MAENVTVYSLLRRKGCHIIAIQKVDFKSAIKYLSKIIYGYEINLAIVTRCMITRTDESISERERLFNCKRTFVK